MAIEILLVALFIGLVIIGGNFVLIRLIHLDRTTAIFVRQAQDGYWEFISGEHGRDDDRNALE